jgi:paraquat-inducible protein B
MKQPETIAARYVLYFNETLRGLSVGAPVTLLGLPAGEVTAVGLDLDPATLNVRGRVEIVSHPERLIARLSDQQAAAAEKLRQSAGERHAVFQRLIEQRGLRAQLRSGNLLTGQLYVALDYFPNAPKVKVDFKQAIPVLPVVASTLPDIESKLTNIIAKLDALPYEAIGSDVTTALKSLNSALGTLNGTLKDAGTVLNRIDTDVTPELRATLAELRGVIAIADGVLKDGVSGTLTQVNTTLEDLRRPLATADALLKNTDATLLGKNAPVQQDLRDTLQEVTMAARSLRVLMDYLDRHPEALIRGKTEVKP